eukprot:gene11068-23132_t
MERTEEWNSLLRLHRPEKDILAVPHSLQISEGLRVASHVAINLGGNETLINRMMKLTMRKEFSNDPTAAIAEISDVFQSKMVAIQGDLQTLKRMLESQNHHYSWTNHQKQHYKLMLDSLQKRASEHLELFQNAVRTHSENVESRKRRVVKYGQGQEQCALSSSSQGAALAFAMFANGGGGGSGGAVDWNSTGGTKTGGGGGGGRGTSDNLRRRQGRHLQGRGTGTGTGTGRRDQSGDHQSQQQQQQLLVEKPKSSLSDSRVRNAEKIEATIAQMATLVKDQSNTIMRIEDDVETGLQDTTEAHESIMNLYEITKGNRSMIFKIFGLLIFFAFLFLIW